MWKRVWMLSLLAASGLYAAAHPVLAQDVPAYVHAVDLDIVPAERDRFLEIVKEHAAATVKEPGCRRFDVLVLASDPNHVVLYEVYDNEAAFRAHRESEHFKAYMASTSAMVAKRSARPMTPIVLDSKPQ